MSDEETQARAARMCRDRLAQVDISQRSAREEVIALVEINVATLCRGIRRELGEGRPSERGECRRGVTGPGAEPPTA
jgi:hypothetical protein